MLVAINVIKINLFFYNYLCRPEIFSALGTDPYCRATAIVHYNIVVFGCAHWVTQRYAILMMTSPLMRFVDVMIFLADIIVFV